MWKETEFKYTYIIILIEGISTRREALKAEWFFTFILVQKPFLLSLLLPFIFYHKLKVEDFCIIYEYCDALPT
jgi:hypothetical protein